MIPGIRKMEITLDHHLRQKLKERSIKTEAILKAANTCTCTKQLNIRNATLYLCNSSLDVESMSISKMTN